MTRLVTERCQELLKELPSRFEIRRDEPLRRHTTFRVGGNAEYYFKATNIEDLAFITQKSHLLDIPMLLLGWGSNMLVSDKGFTGLVIHNQCRQAVIGTNTFSATGIGIQQLFLMTAQKSLTGLEFAVGIPGTLGGALISNAGAYRANISQLVETIDLVCEGERMTVNRDWMQFAYRDSILRRPHPPRTVLLSVKLALKRDNKRDIYRRARDFQRQRIEKQPIQASAGSFFKNVSNMELAQSIPDLPSPLKSAGIVPAGYLISACGLKGFSVGGAQVALRHANFLVNACNATATDIRKLANIVKQRVKDQFGVLLEEEALYIGDWSGFELEPSNE